MNLTLEASEVSDLREALQTMNKRLLSELAHADQRQFREMLREKLERFERLEAKLASGGEPRTPPAEVVHFH